MPTVTPYRPKRKRDPRVRALFFQGVYYGLAVGLLGGVAIWGFLLLGGAPLAAERNRAVSTLLACGLSGAALVCTWTWGYNGLGLTGGALVSALAAPLAWLVRLFTSGEEEEDEAEDRAEQVACVLARGLLAVPAGVPVMTALGAAGAVLPFSPGPLGLLTGASALGWLLLLGAGWRWLLVWPGVPPPPAEPQPPALMLSPRQEAELDSNLQLAVARARRERSKGNNEKAVRILEEALRNAEAQGKSVAHLELHWLLAWLYADLGNLDGAMVMFGTVLDLAEPGSHYEREARAAQKRIQKRMALRGASPGEKSPLLEDDRRPHPSPNTGHLQRR